MLPLHYMRFCTKCDFGRLFLLPETAALLAPHITLSNRNVPDGRGCVRTGASKPSTVQEARAPRRTSHLRRAPLLARQAGNPPRTQATRGCASSSTHTRTARAPRRTSKCACA